MDKIAKDIANSIIFAILALNVQAFGLNFTYVFATMGVLQLILAGRIPVVSTYIFGALSLQLIVAQLNYVAFNIDTTLLESALKGMILLCAVHSFSFNFTIFRYASILLVINVFIAVLEISNVLSVRSVFPFLNTFTAASEEIYIFRSSGLAGSGGAVLSLIYVTFGMHLLRMNGAHKDKLSISILGWALIFSSIVFGITGILLAAVYYFIIGINFLQRVVRNLSSEKLRKLLKFTLLFLIVLLLVNFPNIWLIDFVPVLRFYNFAYGVSVDNSATAVISWLSLLPDYYSTFGNGSFGRDGTVYLPDPGIIRQMYGAGIFAVLAFFIVGLFLWLISRRNISIDLLATFLLFIKEWAIWGMFGVHVLTLKITGYKK